MDDRDSGLSVRGPAGVGRVRLGTRGASLTSLRTFPFANSLTEVGLLVWSPNLPGHTPTVAEATQWR